MGDFLPSGLSNDAITLELQKKSIEQNYEAQRLLDRQRELESRRSQIRAKMSPPGALGLPKILEAARLENGIPDSAFAIEAVFNRVLVLQVAMQEGETYKDSKIVLAETTRDRELRKAPIGIIVSAGLKALDILRSHGMDLGHKVVFTHSAPFFVRFDNIGGVDQHLVVLQAGQITASYNLAADLRARRVFKKQDTDSDGLIRHVLVDEDRNATIPQPVGEEY